MPDSYDLTKLTPQTFEHLVNSLALKVLGPGHTSFGPGSDGGRDGYFEGEAPYPSLTDKWSGRWYIQSKFHAPNLSTDQHKWLVEQVAEEIKEFKKPQSKRVVPDNWIFATNIDPSGVPETGAFDSTQKLVKDQLPSLTTRFHIWGGKKILDMLSDFPDIANYYGHFLTPGHVLTELHAQLHRLAGDT